MRTRPSVVENAGSPDAGVVANARFPESECFGWIAFGRESTLPVLVAPAGGHGVFALRDRGCADRRGSRALAELVPAPVQRCREAPRRRAGPVGRSRRAESFVTALDCPDGRRLAVRYAGTRDQDRVHATPASRPIIRKSLTG
ncbi:hypothetical protein [Lentzea sp. CC55]|uniref:hypothetical protein n=1 Tax=Lentzea sp. CC55 TaxID=2884909 RepID=UPI001F3ECEBA|nr:hypothetical protein [Lentzea sp. CC55]MCG8927676.1 hypothetical protein [Lentzea sp. CC55]